MKHFKILVWFDSPQVKWYMKSSTKDIAYELPYELPNDLRLRILGSSEIVEKTQKWVVADPTTQSPFRKKNFGTSDQKLHKNKYQNFLSCPVLLDFLTFCPRLL